MLTTPATLRLLCLSLLIGLGLGMGSLQAQLIIPHEITGDTILCPGDSGSLYTVNNWSSYLWSTGDTTQGITITGPGAFAVQVTDAMGNTGIDTMIVVSLPSHPMSISAPLGTSACYGDTLPICVDPGPWISYAWTNNVAGPTNTACTWVDSSGTFLVAATDTNWCFFRATVSIVIDPPTPIDLGPDMTYCDSTTFALTFPPGIPPSSISLAIYDSVLMQFVTVPPPLPGNFTLTHTTTFQAAFTNAAGCTTFDTLTIYIQPSPQPQITPSGSINLGPGCPVILDAGAGYAAYIWSNGATTQTISASFSGAYFVEVIDLQGCTGRDTVSTFQAGIAPGIIAGPLTGCVGDTVFLEASDPLGTGLAWSTGEITDKIQLTTTGSYWVYLTTSYPGGCTYTDSVFVSISPGMQYAFQVDPDFGAQEGQATVNVMGGIAPYTYQWNIPPAVTTPTIQGLDSGWYQVRIRDANNCEVNDSVYVPYAIGVYPGDCNHDQVVDMNDLLPIGLKFGQSGGLRPNASLNWGPQVAPLWNDTLANGADVRHVDSDGDGSISQDDTLAISVNFGLTHGNTHNRGQMSQGPKLYFMMPSQNLNPGDTVTIPLMLGTMDTPVVNLYGMSFAIDYDTAQIAVGSIKMDFNSSWFGTKNFNMLSLYREDYAKGMVHVGMTRYDSMSVSGFGRVADLVIVIDDHIAKRSVPMHLSFSNIYGQDLGQEEVAIGGLPGMATIDLSTGIAADLLSAIQVYPNPARDYLRIDHPGLTVETLRILDLTGRVLMTRNESRIHQSEISLDNLSTGIYLLELSNEEGSFRQKIMIDN